MDIILAGLCLFVATNIDDVIILSLLFHAGYKKESVIFGQITGIVLLALISILIAEGVRFGTTKLNMTEEYIGLLGIIPLVMGLAALMRNTEQEIPATEDATITKKGQNNEFLAVTLVTISNGGDNISIYVPFFTTTNSALERITVVTIFFVMTLLWCKLGHKISTQMKRIDQDSPFKSHIDRILPIVLIALGMYILWDNGTITWAISYFQ